MFGHTAPVTCLQFDEIHIITGSLDKSIRVRSARYLLGDVFMADRGGKVWDVRTGGTLETLKYDHGVTAVQFDSRKIVAAAGENAVKVNSVPPSFPPVRLLISLD